MNQAELWSLACGLQLFLLRCQTQSSRHNAQPDHNFTGLKDNYNNWATETFTQMIMGHLYPCHQCFLYLTLQWSVCHL